MAVPCDSPSHWPWYLVQSQPQIRIFIPKLWHLSSSLLRRHTDGTTIVTVANWSYSWLKERSYLCQPHPHPCLGQEIEARRGGPRSVRGNKRTVPLGPTGSDKPVTLTCFPGRSPSFTVTPLTSGNGIQFVDTFLTWLAHWARAYSVLIIRE